MPSGTLKVNLISASGLKHTDYFSKMDPYAIITCGNQCKKSNVARKQGSKPKWNQNFEFVVEEGVSELSLKLMDEDMFTADDELGTVKVPLSTVFQSGVTPATSYNVVYKKGKYKGEVRLELTFTNKLPLPESFHGSHHSASSTHEAPRASEVPYGRPYIHEKPYARPHNEGPYGFNSSGGWREGSF